MPHIRLIIAFILLIQLFTAALYAQTWHLVSTHSQDLKTKANSKLLVEMNIDSVNMEMHTTGNYYDHKIISTLKKGDQVQFMMTINGKRIEALMDKKQRVMTYTIESGPMAPPDLIVRYYLDTLIETLPPVPDSVRRKDSILHAKAKDAWIEGGLDTSKTATVKEDTVILDHADIMPEYPGGKQAMIDYFSDNLRFPKDALKAHTQGFVILKVVIEKDGNIGAISIKRSLSESCNKEAERLVRKMPHWKPGSNNDEPRRVRVEVTVNFVPDK